MNVRTLRSGSCRSCEAIEANWSSSALERASSWARRSSSALDTASALLVSARVCCVLELELRSASDALASPSWSLVSRTRSLSRRARRASTRVMAATIPKAMKISHGSHLRRPETLANSGPLGAVSSTRQRRVGQQHLVEVVPVGLAGVAVQDAQLDRRVEAVPGRPGGIGGGDDHAVAVEDVVVGALDARDLRELALEKGGQRRRREAGQQVTRAGRGRQRFAEVDDAGLAVRAGRCPAPTGGRARRSFSAAEIGEVGAGLRVEAARVGDGTCRTS